MRDRAHLLDVSRLIWRGWTRRLPTGIDRVCLEYVKYIGPRSLAVIQYRGAVFVLSPRDSDKLFDLLTSWPRSPRRRLITLLATAWRRARRSPPAKGMIYLNVGHTGLDRAGLIRWIECHQVRAVHLIHDLIPITHPQYCRPGEAAKHRLRMSNALVSAAGLICNSEATRTALREFAKATGLKMPASTVAWIAGPPPLTPVAAKTLPRPYFVTVGTIEGRKNHLLLLQVWQSLVAQMGPSSPLLVIIGQRGWEADGAISILDNPGELADHINELGRCDDEGLAAWLSGARAVLMPSFVEGFGLPVVEALQLSVPLIASDLPVFREIVGEIPTYVGPADLQGWEHMIVDFMEDGPERSRQLKASRGYRAPDWPAHFARVSAWLERLSPPLATES